MKNIFISFIVVLFCNIPVYSAEPDMNLHLKSLYPVLMVRSGDHMGTGTIISSIKQGDKYVNIVVTCAHVTSDNSDLKVLSMTYENWSVVKERNAYDARLYYADYEKDIALVVFKSDELMYKADLGFDEKMYIGNRIYSFGLGDQIPVPRLDYGTITAVGLEYTENVKIYRSNIYVMTGDSGSSIMYDNKIIGIRFAMLQKSGKGLDHDALIIPIKYLKDMSVELCDSLDFIWDSNIKDIPSVEMFMLNLPKMSDKNDLDPVKAPVP